MPFSFQLPRLLYRILLQTALTASFLLVFIFAPGLPVWAAEAADGIPESTSEVAGETEAPNAGAEIDAGPIIYAGVEAQLHADFALQSQDETQWLELEDDAALTLYRTQRTARERGVFLLVGGRGRAFSQNELLNTLRLELPRLGWHTLAVGLPDRPQLELPPRGHTDTEVDSVPATSAEAESTSSEDSAGPGKTTYIVHNTQRLDSDQQVIEKRLRAALDLARERAKGGSVVVLGVGEGAAWVSWLTQNASNELKEPVILVNFAAQTRYIHDAETVALIQALNQPGLILQEQPYGWADDDLLNNDVELRVLPRGNALHNQRLLRTIRGWLKRRFGA